MKPLPAPLVLPFTLPARLRFRLRAAALYLGTTPEALAAEILADALREIAEEDRRRSRARRRPLPN